LNFLNLLFSFFIDFEHNVLFSGREASGNKASISGSSDGR
jgi:hypothetical protein